MDRLTRRNSYGVSFIKPLDPDCGNCNISLNTMCGDHFNAITERLAAYEDTGLTPEEVKTALRELERYRKLGTVEELNEAVYNASL